MHRLWFKTHIDYWNPHPFSLKGCSIVRAWQFLTLTKSSTHIDPILSLLHWLLIVSEKTKNKTKPCFCLVLLFAPCFFGCVATVHSTIGKWMKWWFFKITLFLYFHVFSYVAVHWILSATLTFPTKPVTWSWNLAIGCSATQSSEVEGWIR